MATRFVRVDLSETARDYRPIAVEPGVPMLDQSGANARIIFRWLGGMVAEPVWNEDAVDYYVRDDKGGRLEDVICQPASAQDLQGILRDDLARLRQRLDQSRGETPTERTLRKVLVRSFQDLADNPGRTDLDSYFFRYRDVLGNWRLIWCCGFERLDHEPAPAVVCTDPECNLLFVRRPGKSPRCPSCEGLLTPRKKKRTSLKIAGLASLLLLLLLLLIGWWLMRPAALVATPSQFTGPVGTRLNCQVQEKGIFSKKDVTADAVGVTFDPRIARFSQATGSIRLTGVGTTQIEFQYGDRKAFVTVTATPSTIPEKLVIEPSTVDLAVGTTARLKAFGEFADGTRVDLTEATEWIPQNDGKVFASGNLVEGLAPGSSTISARYRVPSDTTREITQAATVNVAKGDFQSIDVGVDPSTVGIGLSGKVHVDGVTSDGKRYSLIDSSQLRTEVSPGYIATLQGNALTGQKLGAGRIAVTFGEGLKGAGEFAVAMPRMFGAEVHPENLPMVVGEIADIAYVSPDRSPVHFSCSKAGIVEITPENRVIARAVGDTEIAVTQSGKTLGTVAVTVAKAEFQAIFFDPGSLTVEVDDSIQPKVFAMVVEPSRVAEIAPQLLVAQEKPAPEFALFFPKSFEIAGVKPTDSSHRQTFGVALGGLKATAQVEVVVAPCRLELTPPGPVELPLGQLMRLQGYAHYSGGRQVQVPSERMKWFSQEKNVTGLKLFESAEAYGAVGALEVGAGPLNVYANYHGQESNRVAFRSVEADPDVKLAIDVDRTLRIAGEPGRAVLTATSPGGDVELVPSLTSFASSNDKSLKINKESGVFAALSPGKARVTAKHLAAKDPATKDFQVCDPAKAKLVFDPPSVRVPVNETAALRLMLEAEIEEGGKKETQRAELRGQDAAFFVAQPQSARYNPPALTGLSPSGGPFEVSAMIRVLRPATAKVEVVDSAAKGLRITPSAPSPLAPNQPVSLTVEQQSGDSDTWQEVRPDAVSWTVPGQVVWTPATENLRPTVMLLPDLKGEVKLDAAVGGATATAVFTLKEAGPDVQDATLVLDREPGGKYLPVGRSQRYAVLVQKDGGSRVGEPSNDVHWPKDFENDYVKWEAPVLTAKKEGYTQFMRAEVGGRTVLWHTTTYRPGEFVSEALPAVAVEAKPDWVKIFSQQGPAQVQQVRFPVGATFTDFKVEVHYPDGYTRFVTKKCILKTPESAADAILTADHGKMTGLRKGATKVTAEFQGMSSTVPLEVQVTPEVEVDKIAIEPAGASLRPGESYPLKVVGYKDGRNVGDITGLGGLTWKSSNPAVASMSGPSVIAGELGQSEVTVERKGLTSAPATVTVSNTIADELRVEPKTIAMHDGESMQLGEAIHVYRGDLDVSRQANAVVESPGVIRYDPATRTIHAVNPGDAVLGVAMGDKIARVRVVVMPRAVEIGGELVVEPGSLILAPGQAERLNVFIRTKDGEKIDRTGSAVYQSQDQAVARVDGGIARVCALKEGATTIRVAVGAANATVPLEVKNEEITEMNADPASLQMAVGDVTGVRVFGRAATPGLKEMFPHPDLKFSSRKTDTVAVNGETVRALAVGSDTIDASWRDKLKVGVPVNVAANTIAGLEINPREKTAVPGEAVVYEVSAMRGGNRVILTPSDGVQLNVTNPAAADVVAGTTSVVAKSPGQTQVVAQYAGQKAEAVLNVTAGVPGERVVGSDVAVVDRGPIYDGGGRRIVIGDGTTVVTDGTRVVGDIVPSGPVVALVFKPDLYRAGVQAMPQTAKLLRQYENGGFDDVSDNPDVKITKEANPSIAAMEKIEGGWRVSPKGPGFTLVKATLGDKVGSMTIEINGDGPVGTIAGTLRVEPSMVSLWSGESKTIDNAVIDPGGGQAPVSVPVRLTAPEGQGIVSVEGNKIIGRSVGDATVTATTDGGQSVPIMVHVSAADSVAINPAEISVQIGQPVTPAVMARGTDGTEVAVPAPIESLDKNVLDVDPAVPGQFVARAQGQTQLRAVYRGREVFAKVSVTGQRFETVRSSHNRIDKDQFDMTIEVLAASGEGELEYRVYPDGANPKETWVPNQPEGSSRKVTLRTDPLRYDSGDTFHLVIEARDKKTNSIQKYPLTLVRSVTVEQQK